MPSLSLFKPELLRDIDMLLMCCNKTIQAEKHYEKINNKYMKGHYRPEETNTCIQYLVENNLNGWTMIQKLPTHGFECEKKVDDFNSEKN